MDKDDKKVEQPTVDIAGLAKEISAMVKSDLEAEQKAAEEAKKAKEAEEARIAATATTAAEKMIADLREQIVEKEKTLEEALSGVRDLLKKQAEEGELQKAFSAENKGKMEYTETQKDAFNVDQNTRFGMIYASKLLGKDISQLDKFKDIVTKSGGEHWDSSVADYNEWETEWSTTVQNEMREDLVIEPLFTSLPMSTPTMKMPINPEAGDATWIEEGAYRSDTAPWLESGDGSDTSTGVAQNHQLEEQVLTARKLATREYIGYEEEEDSIIALAPIITDAVARRMARSTDLALLRGAGSTTGTYDPILGLEGRAITDVTVPGGTSWEVNSGWSEDLIVNMRRELGIYGLDPSQLVLLASHDLYYALMKLPNFKTVDVLADRATIITGQVGSLFGVRVVVSQNFANTNAIGETLGIMCRPSNFVIGNLRGIMTEADRDIVNQKRVLVSSRRFAFESIIAGQGTVNLQVAT